jgi:hypothetical protein
MAMASSCAYALLTHVNSKPPPSSTSWIAGKALCIFATFTYGLLTALIDIVDPHHLQNPAWPGHAKLHLLWLISAGALGAFTSIYLFWTATPRSLERIRTGALLGAIHIAGFFSAAIFKNMAGAEFDADGRVLFGFLPPAMLHLSLSASLLAAGVYLCHKKGN